MAADDFFSERQGHSEVKTTLVVKYFRAWAKVMLPRSKSKRIAYVDLYSGQGRYKDGTPSTPLLILEEAINNEKLRESLVTIFNDVDPSYAETLRKAIASLPGVERLRYPPKVWSERVGTEIAKLFSELPLVPTLSFLDPWGYDGLSLDLVGALIKDWGCECILFDRGKYATWSPKDEVD